MDFLDAISKSFSAYLKKGGARSNKKLIPIHGWLANALQDRLDAEHGTGIYTVTALGIGDGKESKLEDAKYYSKTLDVAISKDAKIITTVSLKFVTSNYKQNANNYFENLLGETANIRRVGVGFAHLLILRENTPYYDKSKGNRRGVLKKIEKISKDNLQKYLKLFDDGDFPHKPDVLGIALIDIDEKSRKVNFAKLDDYDLQKQHKSIFSVETFIDKVMHLIALKS